MTAITANRPAVGRRKEAIVRVRLSAGTGTFTLNGRSLEDYFPNKVHQQLIREPFVTLEKDNQYDVVATLSGGGITGQAGALRLGIARVLIALEPDDRPALKKAGFLTRDPRVKERKKYGLKKARKAPQYSKRARALGRYFGTDGVRGLANGDVTPELVLAIASAAARVLASHDGSHRPVAVVGRDPPAVGEMLEAAVVAGLTSAGADVLRVGILPTPAIAFLTADYNADVGVMLSASHNPMPDNGPKFFARGGVKLPDDIEAEIEAELERGWTRPRPVGAAVGGVVDAPDGAARYIDHLLAAAPTPLTGIKVVVDCAHGAASAVAGEVYAKAGADVITIAAEPDGLNINDGVGSTNLEFVARAVLEHGADLGIAHDGDADRCLAVDAAGELVDGDQILAVCAVALRDSGRLVDDTVVATVMSNLGFHHAMRDAGIHVLTTSVGDRYVLEALTGGALSLGGEQSGHVIFRDSSTTGDGLLTGLRLMGCMADSGRTLADLAALVRRLPQVLINVTVPDRAAVALSEAVAQAVDEAERELGDDGRILLRASGTEQLVRVMVEAPTAAQAQAVARRVADVVAGG